MRFNCSFEHLRSDETKEIVVTLTDEQRGMVEQVRASDGDEQALLIGQACALRHAYSLIDPRAWFHTEPPAQMLLS